MASNKRSATSAKATTVGSAAAAGLATMVGGSAFLACPSSSSPQPSTSLRATVAHGVSQGPAWAPAAAPSSSASVQAGLGAVAAASLGALLARGGRPQANAKISATALRAFESELGVQAPVGYFDPLGLAKDGDAVAFKRRRVTELKNGRVAMIATMGYVAPEFSRFPGYCSTSAGLKFSEIPNGLAALSKLPPAGTLQWIAFCGFIETVLYPYDESRSPGDYANGGVLGIPNSSTLPEGADKKKKLNSELANGRLAMMAIIGMFFQDGLTGSAWGDWASYTASPLRAFENELGVQAPVGYFDPLGCSKDGDTATFMRRRSTELKHGRIAMLATMGYITPEITGKFPGYLSFSQDIKFADVPNGLAAISKVPAAGWMQILGYMALCENSRLDDLGFSGWGSDIKRGTPGDFGFKVLTSDNPAGKAKKLNSELANGRLAMMAIIGMFFQDGLTGSAWGDWSLYTDSPMR